MVGRLLSFWEGSFSGSGAMLNFRRVDVLFLMVNKKFAKHIRRMVIPVKTGDKNDIKQSTVVKQSPSNAIRTRIIDGFIFVGCQKNPTTAQKMTPTKNPPCFHLWLPPKKTKHRRNATKRKGQRRRFLSLRSDGQGRHWRNIPQPRSR